MTQESSPALQNTGAPRRIDLPLLCEIERRRDLLFPPDVDQATKQLCWKSIYDWAVANNYEFARSGRDWKYLRDQIWSTNLKCRVLRRIHLEGDAFYARCSEMDKKVLDIVGRDGTSTYKPRGERAPSSGRRSALANGSGTAAAGLAGAVGSTAKEVNIPTMVSMVARTAAPAACASPHYNDDRSFSSPGTPTLSASAVLQNLGLFNALAAGQHGGSNNLGPMSLLAAANSGTNGLSNGAFGSDTNTNTLLALAANLAAFTNPLGTGTSNNLSHTTSNGTDSVGASDTMHVSDADHQHAKRARLDSQTAGQITDGPINLNNSGTPANADSIAEKPLDGRANTSLSLWNTNTQSGVQNCDLIEAQTYKAKLDCIQLELQLGIPLEQSKYPEIRNMLSNTSVSSSASTTTSEIAQ